MNPLFCPDAQITATNLGCSGLGTRTPSLSLARRAPSSLHIFWKVALIHFLAKSIVYASASSWAFEQTETAKAWELARSRGSGVVVAVIDTGLDQKHMDLKNSLWNNPGETGQDFLGRDKATNGVDDDHNGFVDDVHGWNFAQNSNDPRDDLGHGTHVAGIIASRNKSGFGADGIAPESRLMILKYYDPKASALENLKNSNRAFEYALKMKAQIINFSGGGPGANSEEESLLRKAEKQGVLVVAAAGNEGQNCDRHPFFPANYPLSNIIAVTALDQRLKIPSYGNHGVRSVHLAAPGDAIVSSVPRDAHQELSGTSQATAFVSGAAALLLGENPSLSPSQIIAKMMAAAIPTESLIGKTQRASRLSAFRPFLMKNSLESAAGFQFENSSEMDPRIYTIPSSWIDPRSIVSHGGRHAIHRSASSF